MGNFLVPPRHLSSAGSGIPPPPAPPHPQSNVEVSWPGKHGKTQEDSLSIGLGDLVEGSYDSALRWGCGGSVSRSVNQTE